MENTAQKKTGIRCVRILSYTIPFFGNKRCLPYGKMLVELGGKEYTVAFGECEGNGETYVVCNRRRYYYTNKGSLYSPFFVFKNEEAA